MEISIDQLCRLPLEKRLEIFGALWDSIEEEAGPFPISDELLDECDREFEAHLADPRSSIPWEEVRARMRESLNGADPHPQNQRSPTESRDGVNSADPVDPV